MSLKNKINKLIISGREGNYWDFKQCPHENNAELLHDIISMANCLHKGNRYIILGVEDPQNGGEIKGLNSGQKNRKKQADIIDFLRSKQFAGNLRPEIELKTITIENNEIDIIIILDKPNKPYYIIEDYRDKEKCVKANYIYTRKLDTNTPINKSADIYDVEKMWRERFGLDLSPIERMRVLLKRPNEWFKDLGNKRYAYHKKSPEFHIEFSRPREITEVYNYFYTNPKSYLGEAIFKYHSTTLFELEYITVDEMRLFIAAPKTHCIRLDNDIFYFYYNTSKLNGIFHYFLTNGDVDRTSRGNKCQFLFFRDEQEQKDFEKYLIKNKDSFIKTKPDFIATHAKEEIERDNIRIAGDPVKINKVRLMYEKWCKRKGIQKIY